MKTGTSSHSGKGRAIRLISGLVLVGSMIASYTATRVWLSQAPPDVVPLPETEDDVSADTPIDPFISANGMHLIAFVVTASNCGWSTLPEGMEAIGSLRTRMKSTHGDSYARVSVVGIALDTDLRAGLRFLADLGAGTPGGAFDQISVGGSWLNEQAVRFFWRERVAVAATPQIVVIERPVDTGSYLSDSTIRVRDDTIVANPRGHHEILNWLERGMSVHLAGEGA